jgi:multidrug efflux pump subunit AcrA (membrane-fusion protein)
MGATWLRILGLLLFVGVLAGAGGWYLTRAPGGSGPVAAPAAAATVPASDAKAEAPAPKIDRNSLVLPGVIEPYESVPVSAKLTAAIASLTVRDGSMVSKGQLLCVLDDEELARQIDSIRLALMNAQEGLRRAREAHRADAQRKAIVLSAAQRDLESFKTESRLQAQEAQTALTRAERDAADYETLYQTKAVPGDEVRVRREKAEDAKRALEQRQAASDAGLASRQKALEQAQLDLATEAVSEKDVKAGELAVANAQSELAERRRRLADLRVTAPVSGTVRFIPRTRTSSMMPTGQSAEVLGPGVRVYEGDPFLEIATTERACVRVDVDETDIQRVHIGMKAKITGDAFPGRELPGEVSEIQIAGRKAGQGVTLFPVTILITSPLQGVRMGMTADVTIKLGEDARPGKGG